jgi:hypothetical protein
VRKKEWGVRLTSWSHKSVKGKFKEEATSELGCGFGWAGPAGVKKGWKSAQDQT